MKVKISDIKVPKKRLRADIGDLSALMKSMSNYGLLQPIVINNDYILIAGYRRYLAAKRLNWLEIDAKIVDVKNKLDRLELEIDENTVRKDFTFDEINNAIEVKEKLSRPSIFAVIANFFKRLFGIR
ncbi:MAG TPA: ParB N-terminal domain-containing protein [Spirochaetota bacterium]|nr:ParB N-terminal domain-containing protein [Spirochaetota bacterium]HOS33727.1 ParB N-terminal domain-containing protein [Spirochaetota bacterium]HOS54750.1 ParB N-terminal domain-containing protein [Spirochaetota bacterium]HPK61753.1 ParB N-terminal domain-containing protein [Spirochaetota bacterium]HQF77448.1 ParB N-terminal domain-containing protein [Spirochaetota bacterium]